MKKTICCTAALVFLATALSAQNLQTGYFLGGYDYAYRMNPAFQNERTLISFALGPIGLGAHSDMGISTFLVPDPQSGKLVTFMNDRFDQLSGKSFLGQLKKGGNDLSLDIDMNLLAVGFWAGRNYFTIDVGIRSMENFSLPYDLFRFLKDGSAAGTTFDLSGTGFHSKNFIEGAFGWSRNFDNKFNVGGRLKLLAGVAAIDADMASLKMTMDRNKWEIRAQGEMSVASPMASFSLKEDEDGAKDDVIDLSSLDVDASQIGLAGFGAAVDLGATWNVLPWLTLSGALLDLGGISWSQSMRGKTSEAAYTYEPKEYDLSGEDPFADEADEIADAIEGIYEFHETGDLGRKFDMLPWRLNLGAEARAPFYDRLSLGLLYSVRHGASYNWDEARISLNWNPLNFLSFSGSTAFRHFGRSLGAAMNFHPAGIHFILGVDYIPTRIAAIPGLDLPVDFVGLPIDGLNFNAWFGLQLAFGKRRLDYGRRYIL